MKKLILFLSLLMGNLFAEVSTLEARFETTPIPFGTDTTDDVAIWTNSKESLIIGVNKNKEKMGGLGLYDLSGSQIRFYDSFEGKKLGPINNIDLRKGFGGTRDIIAGSNRGKDSGKKFNGISLLELNGPNKTLDLLGNFPIINSQGETLEPYGICMYQPEGTGRFFVFSALKNGELYQYEIIESQGKFNLPLVRIFNFKSIIDREKDVKLAEMVIKEVLAEYQLGEFEEGDLQLEMADALEGRYQLEGCVADDHHKTLYVGMEKLGIYKIDLSQDEFNPRLITQALHSQFDKNPGVFLPTDQRITDDIEGMAIHSGPNGGGFLLVSIQGINEYAAFDRIDDTYLGSFKLKFGENDPITQTDGLDISSSYLGEAFPNGILVVHDHQNTNEEGEVLNANYKIIDLEEVKIQFLSR